MKIGTTRFAIHFFALQSKLKKCTTLKAMVTSNEWAELKDVKDHRENVEMVRGGDSTLGAIMERCEAVSKIVGAYCTTTETIQQ